MADNIQEAKVMSLQMEHLSTFPKMRRSVSGLTVLSVPKTIAVLVICLRTHRTQSIVIFVAVIYYSTRDTKQM